MRTPLMRTLLLVLIAAALGVSSAFLVACGDRNDLIPRDDAAAIESNLDEASDLYSREECRAAQAQIVEAQGRAQALPDQVDGDLRTTLELNLRDVLVRIQQQCGKTQTTQTQTTQTQTQTTQPTQTTQTTTEPPTTTTEPPPTTTTTEPPTTTTEPSGPGSSGGTPPGGGAG